MEIIDRNNGYVLLRVGPERKMYDAGQAGGRLLEEAVRTGVRSMSVSRAVYGRTSISGRWWL